MPLRRGQSHCFTIGSWCLLNGIELDGFSIAFNAHTLEFLSAGISMTQSLSCLIVFGEQTIHVLKFQTLRLREEEIYNGDPARVENCEDNIRFVADVGECDGRDLYDHVVEDPVACCGDR